MRKAQLLLCLVCLTFILHGAARAQEWRGIRVLRSTRSDVEKLIGKPMEPGGWTYDLKDERVTIPYSDASCTKGWPFGWNVPEGTVLGIDVYLKKKVTLDELGIDLSGYKKFEDAHVGGITYYSSAEKGMSIQTNSGDGKVVMFEYSPAVGDNHLLCPEAAARESEIKRGESSEQEPFLSYPAASSPEDEQRLLKHFAEQVLKHPPGSKAYIIAYAGRRARANEAQMLTGRARDYLVNKLGLEAKDVVAVDGGYQEEARVDLYIIEPGSPKPLASPTVHPKLVQLTGGS